MAEDVFVREIKQLAKDLANRRKTIGLNTKFLEDQRRLEGLFRYVDTEGLREAVESLRYSYASELKSSNIKNVLEFRKDELKGICTFSERPSIQRERLSESELLSTSFTKLVKDCEITAEMVAYTAQEQDDDPELEMQIAVSFFPNPFGNRLSMWLSEADNADIARLAKILTGKRINMYDRVVQALTVRRKRIAADATVYQMWLEHVTANNLVSARSVA